MDLAIKRYIDLNNLISFWNKVKTYIDSSISIMRDDIKEINDELSDISDNISYIEGGLTGVNIISSKGEFDPLLYPYMSSIKTTNIDKVCNIVIPAGNDNTADRLEWLMQNKDNLMYESISEEKINEIMNIS